jgi:hypothetical protein
MGERFPPGKATEAAARPRACDANRLCDPGATTLGNRSRGTSNTRAIIATILDRWALLKKQQEMKFVDRSTSGGISFICMSTAMLKTLRPGRPRPQPFSQVTLRLSGILIP